MVAGTGWAMRNGIDLPCSDCGTVTNDKPWHTLKRMVGAPPNEDQTPLLVTFLRDGGDLRVLEGRFVEPEAWPSAVVIASCALRSGPVLLTCMGEKTDGSPRLKAIPRKVISVKQAPRVPMNEEEDMIGRFSVV